MPNDNGESLFKKQKSIRPKIEEIAGEALQGDALRLALDFVAFLRENKMSPQWANANTWGVNYRSFGVCRVHLNEEDGSWSVLTFIGEYEGDLLSEEYKEIVWAQKKRCNANCSGGNCGLKISNLFGREYKGCERSLVFYDPGAKTLDCVKKLIELRRDAIINGTAQKHVYVAIRNR